MCITLIRGLVFFYYLKINFPFLIHIIEGLFFFFGGARRGAGAAAPQEAMGVFACFFLDFFDQVMGLVES